MRTLVITFSRRYCAGTSIIVSDLVRLIRSNTGKTCTIYDKSYFQGKEEITDFAQEQQEIRDLVRQSNERDGNEVLIFIGRASAFALKDYEPALHIYCYASKEDRIKRAMEIHNLSRQEAFLEVNQRDQEREEYHFKHTDRIWSEVDHYQILLDTSRHGAQNCGEILYNYLTMHELI